MKRAIPTSRQWSDHMPALGAESVHSPLVGDGYRAYRELMCS